jgi:hypothetical protein
VLGQQVPVDAVADGVALGGALEQL